MRTKRLGEPRPLRTQNIKPYKQEDPLLYLHDTQLRGLLTEGQLSRLLNDRTLEQRLAEMPDGIHLIKYQSKHYQAMYLSKTRRIFKDGGTALEALDKLQRKLIEVRISQTEPNL